MRLQPHGGMLDMEYRNQQDLMALNAGYWCFLRTALSLIMLGLSHVSIYVKALRCGLCRVSSDGIDLSQNSFT